jgi:hypothetical protein
MIQPTVPEGTQASVFAVFDDKKKLQFVGFSKDVRNSLRTVFSRRPDRAFFYKRAPAPLAPTPGVACTCESLGKLCPGAAVSASHDRHTWPVKSMQSCGPCMRRAP